MRGLKIRVIILVFAAVLLVGVGGRYIHYQKRVVDPMAAAASSLPGVASLEVVETPEGGTNVLVELGPEVQLEKVYPQLQAIVTSSLGANFNQLILIDNRSAELEEIYHRLHFTVQEGISTGLFAKMADEIDQIVDVLPFLTHRIFVGERHVYIQLHDSDGYLYEVVPRLPVYASDPTKGGLGLW